MIQANELRIGNWIDDYHSPYDRAQITAEHFSTIDADGFINGNPIPLTPEILEKCGFEKEGLQCDYTNNGVDIDKTDDGYVLSNNGSTVTPTTKGCMNYLHQLQNLYFALTGEELDVKL